MKDSLPTNDPAKVIKGAEFSTEFTAIQTAFGQAAPIASPTFTGTVTTAALNASGNVGIGTASPANLLHVKGASAGALELARFRLEGATNNPMLKIEADEANQTAGLDVSGSTATELTFSVAGTERARIDTSGNALIGTTTAAGSLSNTARVTGGIFSTNNGTTSVPNATWTTLATIPIGDGIYLVTAYLPSSGDPASYNAVSIVTTSLTGTNLVDIKNANQVALRMSGSNFQVNHGQGTTQPINWSILRLA